VKKIILFFIKLIALLFYDKKYLQGRYFETTNLGWVWVLKAIFYQRILGFNRSVPWPISPFFKITNHKNIIFSPNELNNFQSNGCYFQSTYAKIYIGEGVQIASNVGLITSNHDLEDLDKRAKASDIILGKDSWIGMNSVVLPGVELGEHTIVAAGAIVTKSFKEGYVVLAGNPAKIIKDIPRGRE
jgi:acetyltransferase-like isoleucine patch superfamily enzyme